MLKKFFLFMVGVGLLLNISMAESVSEFYSISSREIISQNEESVTICFDIHNNTGNYYPELYYVTTLETAKESVEETLPYKEYGAQKFSLFPYESKLLIKECDLPEKLPNKELILKVEIYSKSYTNPISSFYYIIRSENRFEGFLEKESEPYWKNGKDKLIDAIEEISVDKNNFPKMYLKLKSSFKEEKVVLPSYVVYERNETTINPIYRGNESIIVFKPGETKEIELNLPNLTNSKKYLLKLSFIDGVGNRISSIYEYKYIISGESARVTNIFYDKENSVLRTYLYGTKELKGVDVDINVYDKNKNLISTKKSTIDLKTEDMYLDMELQNILEDIVFVTVKVSFKGKELAKKTEELNLSIENATDKFIDIKNLECERSVKILNGLNIINGYPDNTYKPGNNVTRAEFSTIVTKLKDLETIENDLGVFSDISNHWAKPYINTLNKKGFVSGYPDGTFGPQNNVTYSEAVTILLNAMGYREEVNESKAGWPYNYIIKSREIGLTDGVNIENFSAPANRGNIAMLTLNAYSLK